MNLLIHRTRDVVFVSLGYLLTVFLGVSLTSILGNLLHATILEKPFIKATGNPHINPIVFLIVGVVIAPVVEEIIFRFPLAKLKIADFFLSLALYFIFISFSNTKFIVNPSVANVKINYLIISGFLLLTYFFVNGNLTINKKYQLSFALVSSFLFGIGHFIPFDEIFSLNIQGCLTVLISSILLILTGLYFSFIRLKFGFLYSLGLHFCINLAGFLFKFIF